MTLLYRRRVIIVTNSPTVPQTVTAVIEHDARPQQFIDVISDVGGILRWAPKLADRVEPAGEGRWAATRGGETFILLLSVIPEAGVVDQLREREGQAPAFGARFRAMPRDDGGSVVTMTMPVVIEGDVAKSTQEAQGELNALGRVVAGGANEGP
jgi:hypothetical protein